jgi:Skp family chaperone for outer membrane proteins
MKRNLCILAVLLLACGMLEAQNRDPADFKRDLSELKLNADELDSIEKIIEKNSAEMEKNRADLQILQAQLGRQLLEKDPDIESIKKIVRQSLEIEFKMRMIQIERQLKLRELLGPERAQILFRLARVVNMLEKTDRLPDKLSDEKARGRFLKILKDLL